MVRLAKAAKYDQYADDIDALPEEEQDLDALVESLDTTCTRYTSRQSAGQTIPSAAE